MTYASEARGWSAGKVTAVAVLAILAILAIIATILFFTEPAKSLPSVLGTITSPAARADAHRTTRGVVSLIAAVILVAATWFASRTGRASRR